MTGRLFRFPRIHEASGDAWETGFRKGRDFGPGFSAYIDAYLNNGSNVSVDSDRKKRIQKSLNFPETLPDRFRMEFEGFAAGSGIPICKIAEWIDAENSGGSGCSGFIAMKSGRIRLGRNNDFRSPGLWGYLSRRRICGAIAHQTFGLAADVFTATGQNRAGLWLHYNYLKAPDSGKEAAEALPCYIQIVQMLECCESLNDVSLFLESNLRPDGMMLFALKDDPADFRVFECSAKHVSVRNPRQSAEGIRYVCGTNHFIEGPFAVNTLNRDDSRNRLNRLEEMVPSVFSGPPSAAVRTIVSDSGIEKRLPDYGTVYSNVFCPAEKVNQYTFGGYPAASRGKWRPVPPL